MASQDKSAFFAGLGLVRRHHRLLWWLFALNFAFGVAATLPVANRLRPVLDPSLAADNLYHRMDAVVLVELLQKPGIGPGPNLAGAMFLGFLYAVVVLFLTGGILESYYTGRKLATGEFFAACGNCFWRFVRLALMFVVVTIPVIILGALVNKRSGQLASDAASEKLGFWVQVAGLGIVLLLAFIVRLWFDLAQIETLAESERTVRRSLRRAFGLTFRTLPSLLGVVLRIYIVGCALTALALWVWVGIVPPQHAGSSFLIWELVALLWLACGLWRRAAETAWYQQHAATPRAAPLEPQALISETPMPSAPLDQATPAGL